MPIGTKWALGFLDLTEIRFVDAFIDAGVSWKTLRKAQARAESLVNSTHPFSTRAFATDGHAIFAQLDRVHEDTEGILEVISRQHYFEQLIRPALTGLEFRADHNPDRWWPLGLDRHVVIDPGRSFGRPIVSEEGVPTYVLARAWRVERDARGVCNWFDVSEVALKDAVEFEGSFAA